MSTTALKGFEEAALPRDDQYRGLVDNLMEGAFRTSLHGSLLMADEPGARMLGYDSSAELMATVTDEGEAFYVDPARRDELVAAMKQGPVTDFEAQVYRRDRSTAWVAIRAGTVFDNDGIISHFEGTFIDITNRNDVESLRRTALDAQHTATEREVIAKIGRIVGSSLDIESIYRRFADEAQKLIEFERITITLVDQDEDSAIVAFATSFESNSAQPALSDIYPLVVGDRYTLDKSVTGDAMRKRTTLLIQQDEASKIPTLAPNKEFGGQSFLTTPLIFQDRAIGALVFRSVTGVAYGEKDIQFAEEIGNQIAGAIGISQMYGNLQKAESAQRESEFQYHELVDNLMEGVFRTTPKGSFLMANTAMALLLGYDSPDDLMTTVTDVGNQLHVDPVRREELVVAVKQAPVTDFEAQMYRKDGRIIWVTMRARAVSDDQGRLSHFEGTLDDITERKSLQREVEQHMESLEQAYGELQDLDQLKDNFLSSVSHELRTPLTAIKGSAEILLDGEGVDDAVRTEFLEIINSESDRLTRLINDVLDLAKIEAGSERWEDGSQSIAKIVDTAVSGTRSLALQKNHVVEIDLNPDLPSVWCDQDKMVQVVMNLLSNAIKFTPEGGHIRVCGVESPVNSGASDERTVEIKVADSGIGMEPKDLEDIFQKFKQVGNNSTDLKTGTGLGLPICKEIVEHYGGKIWAESDMGEGSTITFVLPLGQNLAIETPVYRPQPISVKKPSRTKKMILVVDDEANVRKLLNHELSKIGYDVLEAADGNAAVRMAREHHPDLITMDVQMPALDGYDATLVIKNDPGTRDIPVLVISIVENQERGLEIGATGYLSKPFTVDEMLQAVEQSIGGTAKKVVIADDDLALAETIRFELEKRGFFPSTAGCGEDALEQIIADPPDLVVLDLVMPGKDGFEVVKEIKKRPELANIPVIVLSGMEIDGAKVRALSLGAAQFISKSEGLARLHEEIERILSQ